MCAAKQTQEEPIVEKEVPPQLPEDSLHTDDPVRPKKSHTASGQAANISFDQEYSYTAQHCLHSLEHKPGDNGIFIKCRHHQHKFDLHPQTLQKSASLENFNSYLLILPDVKKTQWQSSPDVHTGTFPNSQLCDKETDTAVHSHTYYNLPQKNELLVSTQHEPTASDRPAATTKEPMYTTLLGREVYYHDYVKLSPSHTSYKCLQSSPPKPQLAHQPKQIISKSTSRLDYKNISVWLSSEKKPSPQSAKPLVSPSGYTSLLHNTMTEKSDYDTLRQHLSPK